MKTQKDLILDWFVMGGSLTPLESLKKFGIMALSQRCGELRREGYPIKSELVEVESHKRVARYSWDYDAEKIAFG